MNKTVFLQIFVDPVKWDAAKWMATAFFCDPTGTEAPLLGIVFENIEVGKQIFADWRERFGEVDEYDELRISIVEGEILGEDPGYTMHISSNPGHTEERMRAQGEKLEIDTAIIISRMYRMTPQPGSPYLSRFKQEFAKHRRYFLMPVSSDVKPEWDLALGKSEIHFRQASEITREDLDAAVFPIGYFDRDSTIQ